MLRRVLLPAALVAGLLVSAGCYSLSQPPPEPPVRKRPLPFAFAPLGVPNGCFIEAVRFHDAYVAAVPAGPERWVKLFQFGSRAVDVTGGMGHSVAFFRWKNRLCLYDINQGVIELPLRVEQGNDPAALAPHAYRNYQHLDPTKSLLLTDVWHLKRPGRVGAREAVDTEVYRQVARVADELGRVRATRVVRFSHLKDGTRVESAAAIFSFEGKLCLYVPELGTLLGSAGPLASVQDLGLIRRGLAEAYGPAAKLELILPP